MAASVAQASTTATSQDDILHPFASSSAKPAKPKAELTRSQLAKRIAQGETLVLRGRAIYKLDAWLPKHPGGELAILHFVGRDASDEIEVYHSEDTLRRMKHFQIGVLAEVDYLGKKRLQDGAYEGYRPLLPPIQLGYRNGKLEHPDAHDELWERIKEKVHREEDGKSNTTTSDSSNNNSANEVTGGREDSPEVPCSSRASDSGYSDGDTSNVSVDEAKRGGLQSKTTATMTKPLTMPLPVDLLEPPADPPGIDAARERQLSHAFKQLHEDVRTSGLYELRPGGYAREMVRYVLLGATAFALWYYAQGRSSFYLASAFFLGLFWHQLTFTAHDAGHSGITHNHAVDRIGGIFIADYLGGLSIGWWCASHDVHHLVTNHPEHDPDIQHMPFFAVSPKFLVSRKDDRQDDQDLNEDKDKEATPSLGLWSSYYRRVLEFDAAARFLLQFQNQYYYFVMSLGRFNLYAESYGFLLTMSQRTHLFWMEWIGILFFWTWFGSLLASLPNWKIRIAYVLISHMVTSPLHVQIVLSHFAQSSQDLGLTESFVSRQLRTTMDVACPTYLDFIHGGLHMQVSHHLFPRLPRHNLRECRDRFVRPFAEKWGVEYSEYSFTEGNKKVLGVLKEVADQVRILGKVAAAQARGELH